MATRKKTEDKKYSVEIGSFDKRLKGRELVKKAEGKGFHVLMSAKVGGYWKVRTTELVKKDADATAKELSDADFDVKIVEL